MRAIRYVLKTQFLRGYDPFVTFADVMAEYRGDFAFFHQANRSIVPGLYTKKLHKHPPINVSYPPHGVWKRQGVGVAGENRGSLRPAHVRG